jgi:hypothetical protein
VFIGRVGRRRLRSTKRDQGGVYRRRHCAAATIVASRHRAAAHTAIVFAQINDPVLMKTRSLSFLSIADAQQDMRQGYYVGPPGVLISGLAWLVAGIVALVVSQKHAVLALLAGSALIFPVGVVRHPRLWGARRHFGCGGVRAGVPSDFADGRRIRRCGDRNLIRTKPYSHETVFAALLFAVSRRTDAARTDAA